MPCHLISVGLQVLARTSRQGRRDGRDTQLDGKGRSKLTPVPEDKTLRTENSGVGTCTLRRYRCLIRRLKGYKNKNQ